MYVDPITIMWGIIIGASYAAYMIGVNHYKKEHETTIEDTITYLCESGFIRHRTVNGEIEIMPWNYKKK